MKTANYLALGYTLQSSCSVLLHLWLQYDFAQCAVYLFRKNWKNLTITRNNYLHLFLCNYTFFHGGIVNLHPNLTTKYAKPKTKQLTQSIAPDPNATQHPSIKNKFGERTIPAAYLRGTNNAAQYTLLPIHKTALIPMHRNERMLSAMNRVQSNSRLRAPKCPLKVWFGRRTAGAVSRAAESTPFSFGEKWIRHIPRSSR